MEIKTPMVFVKHITAAQRGNAASIQYLCDHTSDQFVKICQEYNLSNSEIETVLAKAYGQIFDNIKSVRNPQKFMSWATDLVNECCREIASDKARDMGVKAVVSQAIHDTVSAASASGAEARTTSAVTGASGSVTDATGSSVTGTKASTVGGAAGSPAAGTSGSPAAGAAITGAALSGAAGSPAAGTSGSPAAGAAITGAAVLGAAGAAAAGAAMAGSAFAGAAIGSGGTTVAASTPASADNAGKQGVSNAFYDADAYVEPTLMFKKEITYADEIPAEPLPEDKRIIPVDELVYRPEAGSVISDTTRTDASEDPYTEIPGYAAPVTLPVEAPAYEAPAYAAPTAPPVEAPAYEAPAYAAPATPPVEAPAYEAPAAPAYEPTKAAAAPYTAPATETPVHDGDEPDIDLVEREEQPAAPPSESSADTDDIDVNSSESDDEDNDEESDDEIESGLAFRTKVLIGLLCVFIFGACVGVGYAISKGMTSNDGTSSQTGYVETQTPAPEVTETPAQSSDVSAAYSVESGDFESTESAATSVDSAATAESDNPDAVLPAGEAMAREDIGTYLGETFASVFRDYPDIPRSVYRGSLSYANSFIGFIGSYDATQPVSSTVVESVSLLSKAENFNINGFYVGMTAADAESLAAAGGYTEVELTAESSREYIDSQGNFLTLTIDNDLVKNVTLRIDTADDVTMQTADSV